MIFDGYGIGVFVGKVEFLLVLRYLRIFVMEFFVRIFLLIWVSLVRLVVLFFVKYGNLFFVVERFVSVVSVVFFGCLFVSVLVMVVVKFGLFLSVVVSLFSVFSVLGDVLIIFVIVVSIKVVFVIWVLFVFLSVVGVVGVLVSVGLFSGFFCLFYLLLF